MEIWMKKETDEQFILIRKKNDRMVITINQRGDIKYLDLELIGDIWEFTDENYLVDSGRISKQQYNVYKRFKDI